MLELGCDSARPNRDEDGVCLLSGANCIFNLYVIHNSLTVLRDEGDSHSTK